MFTHDEIKRTDHGTLLFEDGTELSIIDSLFTLQPCYPEAITSQHGTRKPCNSKPKNRWLYADRANN